jgi:hypothetical protein
MIHTNIALNLSLKARRQDPALNGGRRAAYNMPGVRYVYPGCFLLQRTIKLYGSLATATLNVDPLTSAVSSAYVAPTPAIHTLTAAGTVTAGGIARITVTSTDPVTGFPGESYVNFTVSTGDTPSVWAGKARAALARDKNLESFGGPRQSLNKRYTVSGSGTAITLTQVVDDVGFLNGDMNIAVENITSTGITTVTSSTEVQASVLATGASIDLADDDDGAGGVIPVWSRIVAMEAVCVRGFAWIRQDDEPEPETFEPVFRAKLREGEAVAKAGNISLQAMDELPIIFYDASPFAEIQLGLVLTLD